MSRSKKRVAVFDTETDPFNYGLVPKPFVVGFYDGTAFRYWWDDPKGEPGNCTTTFADFVAAERPLVLYAHNGGKFDFFFFAEFLEEYMQIQNGRIIKAWLRGQEIRDSYSIIPVPLAQFGTKTSKQKWTDEDYRNKMARENRDRYRAEIINYLHDDCVSLYEGVIGFRKEFGDKLTIGGTSMKQLQKFHPFQKGGKTYDEQFRPFFFGGRVQCFKSGIVQGRYKVLDVNSMYPYVMANFPHPISTGYDINMKITKRTTFVLLEANNHGCLPVRTKTGIDFTQERGTFFASIHEVLAGLETGTLEIIRIKHTIEHKATGTFAEFVDHFYTKRNAARSSGQEMLVTFYKLILNSAYGKFAQNPDGYKDYFITHDCAGPEGWELDQTNGEYYIWSKPSTQMGLYYNVATAASITGAARATLLRGLSQCVDPVYCDTDSIICRDFKGQIDPSQLGAWKEEGSGDSIAIGGKKLYAVFDGSECIKQASKGAFISPEQIRLIAQGGAVSVHNPAPHFKLDGKHGFTSRTLTATGQAAPFQRRPNRLRANGSGASKPGA